MRISKIIQCWMVGLCVFFLLTACGKHESPTKETTQSTSTTQTSETTKTLVIYFSATGTTKEVAERIASKTHADVYEILPTEPYTEEDLDYGNDTSRTSLEMKDPDTRPAIGSEAISLEEYDTIYIGYPIWWGEAPRILSSFVEQQDFQNANIIPFCTSGGSDIGDSAKKLQIQAGSGNWQEGRVLSRNVTDEELQSWIDQYT